MRQKEKRSFTNLLACEIINTGFDKEMNTCHGVSKSLIVNSVLYEKLVWNLVCLRVMLRYM